MANLDLELPADDWLDHAERLGDQAAAGTAVQGQPEGVVLWCMWGEGRGIGGPVGVRCMRVKNLETRRRGRRRESPAAVRDKSCVLKPWWTSSSLSVV